MIIIVLNFSRDNIESTYSEEVTRLRNQYTEEDKDKIQRFLTAKKSFKWETNVKELSDEMLEEIDQGDLSGNYDNVIIIIAQLKECVAWFKSDSIIY